jgi:hypothetical protein
MLVVETVRRIRREHADGKPIKAIARDMRLSRKVVRKAILAPFDGFHETAHAVTGTCLISFDRNRYSVMAKAARRAVQVRAYADRIVVRLGDKVIAEHARHFGRDRTIHDPWDYLPVLANKPGGTAHPSRAGTCRRHWRGCDASWAAVMKPTVASCAYLRL